MRSTILVLALSGSALAVPFADTFNAIFGRADNMYRPHKPHHGGHHHPMPTGTGYPIPSGGFPTGGFPFPTGIVPGGPLPTGSGGMNALPFPNPGVGLPVVSKTLSIDYKIAPTIVAQEKRQAFGTGIVPVMPPAGPTGTGFPHPTGGFPHPTGAPPGGFPTGGFPGIPTTLATFTRAPLPTSTGEPGVPGDDNEGSWWQDWADAWTAWYESHKDE